MDEIKRKLTEEMMKFEEAKRTGVKPEELAEIKTNVDNLKIALHSFREKESFKKAADEIKPTTKKDQDLKDMFLKTSTNIKVENPEMEEMLSAKIDNRIKGELK